MGRYLPDFLKWLPKQTFFDRMEVVLDHNEPSNEELQLVRKFQKRYPGHIKHIIVDTVDPIGVSMNRCIEKASGDFLTIWNVDDLRTPNSIESQARVLIDNRNIDIVYGNYRVVKFFTSTKGELVDHSGFSESELTRSMILGPFFMFRKSLCPASGIFDEQLRSGADFDLAIRLVLHGKAQMVQEELGYYLDEGLGASTRPDSLQPLERTVIELRYGIYDKIDYQYLPKALKYNISNLLKEGQWLPVGKFVPDYESMLSERYKRWFEKGMRNHLSPLKKGRDVVRSGLRKVRSLME